MTTPREIAELAEDYYEKVEPPTPMRNCACCGSSPELWKNRRDPDCLHYEPGCSNAENVLPDFGILHGGCPMYDYLGGSWLTKKAAVQAWNDYNNAIEACQSATLLAKQAEDAMRYSMLMQKTLDLINALPAIEKYKGEYLWPMNPGPEVPKRIMQAISKAALFIDANPRDQAIAAMQEKTHVA